MKREDVAAALAKLTPEERVAVEDLVLEAFANREHERLRREDPEGEERRNREAARMMEVFGPLTPKAEAAVREAFGAVMRARLAEVARTPGA